MTLCLRRYCMTQNSKETIFAYIDFQTKEPDRLLTKFFQIMIFDNFLLLACTLIFKQFVLLIKKYMLMITSCTHNRVYKQNIYCPYK